MNNAIEAALRKAEQLGFDIAMPFDPRLLVPEERVLQYCIQNVCGNYGRNYACPPFHGSLEEIKARLSGYSHGVLLRRTRRTPVQKGNPEVEKAKIEMHNSVLQLEEHLKAQGIGGIWGISGGNCSLCRVCLAGTGEPCLYPDKMRTSLEALGIDVLALLLHLGLDNRFHSDKVTWTGCILFKD